jgi:hypothetical protein
LEAISAKPLKKVDFAEKAIREPGARFSRNSFKTSEIAALRNKIFDNKALNFRVPGLTTDTAHYSPMSKSEIQRGKTHASLSPVWQLAWGEWDTGRKKIFHRR